MNLIASQTAGPAAINIGLLVEGNAYFVADFPHYLAMSADQLDATISHLQQLRGQTFARFIRHRTVPWFVGSGSVLCVAIIATPQDHFSLVHGIATLTWIVGAVLPSLHMMTKQREDLFNALALLKEEIKKAKAARATK